MPCNVPYIRSAYTGHPELIERLEQINSDIWSRINQSHLFREYGKERLFSKMGTDQYKKQVQLIRQINQDYGAPKSLIHKKVTKSGYNEKVVVSVHPIAQQVWFETDAAQRMQEEAAMGITPTGDSDTTLLGADQSKGGTDPNLREKFFSEGNETTSDAVLTKIANGNHPLAPLAKTLLKYDVDPSPVELVNTDHLQVNNIRASGAYHTATGKIEIAEHSTFKGSGSEVTLIHEILHSMSYAQLHSNTQMAKDFEKFFQAAKVYEETFTDKYPLTDVDEFFTGLFSNAPFINELKNIPAIEGTQYKNLWEQILDYFKLLFGIPQEETSLFEQAMALGTNIIAANTQELNAYKEFSTISDEAFLANPTRTGYTQNTPEPERVKTPEEISDNLTTRSNQMELREIDKKQDDGTLKKEPRYFVNGKEIAKRVSDAVKEKYNWLFGKHEIDKNEAQEAINEIIREKGSKGHADFQHALTLMVDDKTHKLLTKEQYTEKLKGDESYKSNIGDDRIYSLLRDNLWDRLHTFDPESIFLSEIGVFNDTRAKASQHMGGTMDLVILEPDIKLGTKVNVLDWKFINLNTEFYDDVPWYKRDAWRLQMETYKKILIEAYGVKEEQFGKTQMIPIVADYQKGYDVTTGKYIATLTDIHIGDVDPTKIPEGSDFLLPVATEGQTTGNQQIDDLLSKLNSLYKQISDQKVAPDQKRNKADRLNNLFTAIRHLQMKQDVTPLLRQVNTSIGILQNLITEYEDKYNGKIPTEIPDGEISDFVTRLIQMDHELNLFGGLFGYLDSIRKALDETSPKDMELKGKIDEAIIAAQANRVDLERVLQEFVDNDIAGKYGYHDILKAEVIVKSLPRLFNSTATIQMESMHVLATITNNVKNQADAQAAQQRDILTPIINDYIKWAEGKGLSKKNYYDSIKVKGKNKLINQYKKEFYDTLKTKLAQGDKKWVDNNVDIETYGEFLKEELAKEIEALKVSPKYGLNADGTPEDNSERNEAILIARKRMNLNDPNSFAWRDYKSLRMFPTAKWESEEFKNLSLPENAPAKALYDYIQERNKYYASIGYISNADARTFLPYIRGGLVERLMAGKKVGPMRAFLNSISIDETTVGYGKYDPLTGEILREIPAYFTSPIDNTETSEDIFSNLILLDHSAIRYKMLSDVEGQVKALLRIEASKGHLNKQGDTEPGNTKNLELLKAHSDALLYGKAYVREDAMAGTLQTATKVFKKINSKLGFKMFPEEINPERRISALRSVDFITRYFYLQQLNNLNIVSPLSNLVGGSLQTFINAGDLFSKGEFAANTFTLMPTMANIGEKAKMRRLALDYFMFTTESAHTIKAAQLSYSKLNSHNMQEWTRGLIGKSDRYVQMATGLSLLDNTILIDGKLKNVNDYVHSQGWYKDRYNDPSTIKAMERRASNEIKALKSSHSVWGAMEIKDDHLTIKGIERTDPSLGEVRRLAMAISQRALGNLSEDQTRMSSIVPVVKGMMVFKNWIPGIIEARTGALKYNAATQAYEWGRLITWWKFGGTNFFTKLKGLIDAVNSTPKGIEEIRKLYDKERENYFKKHGKTLNLTFQEFADLTRSNLRSQARDFMVVASAISLLLLAKALQPDDEGEDPRVKAYHNFILRTIDKLHDEATFYYNPVELEGTLTGKIFPAATVLTDGYKAVSNFLGEMYGLSVHNDEVIQSNHPTKYIMRVFPFAKQMTDMLPMFAPEAAKDWGVRINATHNSGY